MQKSQDNLNLFALIITLKEIDTKYKFTESFVENNSVSLKTYGLGNMIKKHEAIQQEGILNLQDFLVDEKIDELSKYLSLSLENIGENTKINIKTLEDVPITYTSTLIGAPYSDLQCLLEENLVLVNY